MDTANEGATVRGYSEERAGSQWIVLDNGESHLELDATHGGRLVTWDYQPAGGAPLRLLSAPDAAITAGPALLTGSGQTPELSAGLGPASPSGLGDHFLPLTVAQRSFALGQARELGTFAAAPFESTLYAPTRDQQVVALRAAGGIRGAKRITPLVLLKRLTLGRPGGEISAHYRIDNPEAKAVQIYFGVEFCFALDAAAGESDLPAYEFDGVRERGGYGASGIARESTSVTLLDPQPGVTIRLGWERPANVWVCPYPAGAAGAALRGASVVAVWDLRLPPDDNWAVNLWLQVGPSGPVAPLDPAMIARIARPESEDEPWKPAGK